MELTLVLDTQTKFHLIGVINLNITDNLIESAQMGNNYALSQLLQDNYSFVFKYLLKLTLKEQDAKDLTQEVMVKAIKNITSYNSSKGSFSTWLIAIGKNLWLDSVRKQRLMDKFLHKSRNNFTTETTSPMDHIIENDALLNALNTLSPKLRVPIIMQYTLGYSYEEIGKILKIPIGTVKSRISNAMKALRKELISDEKREF